jgi:hypothetical protein
MSEIKHSELCSNLSSTRDTDAVLDIGDFNVGPADYEDLALEHLVQQAMVFAQGYPGKDITWFNHEMFHVFCLGDEQSVANRLEAIEENDARDPLER